MELLELQHEADSLSLLLTCSSQHSSSYTFFYSSLVKLCPTSPSPIPTAKTLKRDRELAQTARHNVKPTWKAHSLDTKGERCLVNPCLLSSCPSSLLSHLQAGPLTDDQLHAAMIQPLRHGVRLHAVIDACQSCPSLNLRCTARSRKDGWSDWQVCAPIAQHSLMSWMHSLEHIVWQVNLGFGLQTMQSQMNLNV